MSFLVYVNHSPEAMAYIAHRFLLFLQIIGIVFYIRDMTWHDTVKYRLTTGGWLFHTYTNENVYNPDPNPTGYWKCST